MARPDVVRRRRPQQCEGDLELLLHDGQRPLDTSLTTCRERPEDRSAEEDALGPQCPRDRDVVAAPHAAVDPDLGPAVDRSDDALQDVDGRLHPVELAGAVIARHDRVHAVLRGKRGRPRAVMMPFSTRGSDDQLRIVARSSQVSPLNCCSSSWAKPSAWIPPPWVALDPGVAKLPRGPVSSNLERRSRSR